MKRVWIVILVVVAVAGLAVVGLVLWNPQAQARPNPLEDGEIYTVSRGEVTEVVEATGDLTPSAQVPLAFSIPGELVEICIATGDHVRRGQVLALLDTTDLELQLDQAQAGLAVAEANLNKVLAEARPEDVAMARSSLTQAVANRDELNATLAAATEQARLSWVQAANNLRDAQQAYENIYWDNREFEDRFGRDNLPDAKADAEAQAWRVVENAEASMEQARLNYEQALQREEGSNRSAQAQVTSAQANLERLENGASPVDWAVNQASVHQAEVSYEQAQANLDKAVLTAPFDGVVATVLAEAYHQVSSATPILILLDPSTYHVDVEVDEIDISQIQVGQEARIFLDALPKVELVGEVTEIARSPSAGQGVVTYRVRVQVTNLQDAPVLPGMTANVDIVAARASDALIVPRRAVRIEGGLAYVERVLANNQLEKVPVELGLADPFYLEIVSGLEEGDQVFVRGVVEYGQAQQLFGPGAGAGRILEGGQ